MTTDLNEKNTSTFPINADSPVLLILLGASNLSRGCFAFIRHMKICLYPRKVEVLIATGPGRGYCASGGLMNVVYPPICSSNIFDVAQEKSKSGCQVVALVTDIGNDIMYDMPTEKVIETLDGIFSRLKSINAEIFYTPLPARFERKVNMIWFYIIRSILFPRSKVTCEQATAGVFTINKFLKETACRYGHGIYDMDGFLGYDQIHYGWLRANHAWSHVAQVILGVMGVDVRKQITLSGMLKSYWEEFRRVVGTDMMGFKKKNPTHY